MIKLHYIHAAHKVILRLVSRIHIFGSKVLPGIICKNTNMNILVKVMLQHRVSVTCVDKIGRVRFKLEKEKWIWTDFFEQTPLHIASFYGFSTIVSYLLDETGSQVDQVDDKGRTALHLAAIRGHVEAANILIHQCV